MQSKRTRLQVVTLAEETWLQKYLVPTDIYIFPLEFLQGRNKK